MIVSARDSLQPSAHVSCLITGATGLVGNNVVRQLVNRNDTVRVLVRPGQRPDPAADARQAAGGVFAALPVDMVSAGLHDEVAMQKAVDGATHVIHSAAMVHCGWRHLAEMRHVNVEGTRVVARAARRAGARLIHVSSVDAIGLRPDGVPADEETPPGGMLECPYVVTKREAEAAVLEEVDKGLDAVIVNPVYMIGPWDWKPSSGRMLLEVGAGRGLFAPPGSNDFVDVRDVAQGILSAMSRGQTGRRYILGGQALSYLDAWRIFARVSGRLQPLGIAPALRPHGGLVRRPGQPADPPRTAGELSGHRHVDAGSQFLLHPSGGRARLHPAALRSGGAGCLGLVRRPRLREGPPTPDGAGAIARRPR